VTRLVLAVLLVTAVAVPSHAQVNIQIGIQLPGPPLLAVIPGMSVYHAPRAPANIFFYANQYWVFVGGGWYVGPTWNGPWVIVAPVYVPAPILHIPVAYYPAPPREWKHWRHNAPPRWEASYGREWHEEAYERRWREREGHWHGSKGGERGGKGCPPGLAKQGRC